MHLCDPWVHVQTNKVVLLCLWLWARHSILKIRILYKRDAICSKFLLLVTRWFARFNPAYYKVPRWFARYFRVFLTRVILGHFYWAPFPPCAAWLLPICIVLFFPQGEAFSHVLSVSHQFVRITFFVQHRSISDSVLWNVFMMKFNAGISTLLHVTV